MATSPEITTRLRSKPKGLSLFIAPASATPAGFAGTRAFFNKNVAQRGVALRAAGVWQSCE
jgi:hypothetical protein